MVERIGADKNGKWQVKTEVFSNEQKETETYTKLNISLKAWPSLNKKERE